MWSHSVSLASPELPSNRSQAYIHYHALLWYLFGHIHYKYLAPPPPLALSKMAPPEKEREPKHCRSKGWGRAQAMDGTESAQELDWQWDLEAG